MTQVERDEPITLEERDFLRRVEPKISPSMGQYRAVLSLANRLLDALDAAEEENARLNRKLDFCNKVLEKPVESSIIGVPKWPS